MHGHVQSQTSRGITLAASGRVRVSAAWVLQPCLRWQKWTAQMPLAWCARHCSPPLRSRACRKAVYSARRERLVHHGKRVVTGGFFPGRAQRIQTLRGSTLRGPQFPSLALGARGQRFPCLRRWESLKASSFSYLRDVTYTTRRGPMFPGKRLRHCSLIV